MPHGHCYLWLPGVLALHIVSDALIALSYYSIPFTLVYFVRKRQDIPFNWMFLCFATFIVACGTTHLMEIWVIWYPTYWLSGLVKAITAVVSVPTAILLVKLVPQALVMPSPATLHAANAELAREIAERKRAEAEALRLNDDLERRVAERTKELAEANEVLKREIAERQRAEQSSRENQQLLQAIIDNSTTVIYAKDLQGRYILVNRRFLDMFHRTEPDVLGKTDHDLFAKVDADAYCALDARVIAANRALTEEETVPQDDGIHTYVSVKSPLWDTAGKPYALFGVSTDITDHKREAEKTKWLASFPEKNPNPIVELDFATGTIHYQNPFATRLFPDLQSRRMEHPYLAGMLVVNEALRIGGSRPFHREIKVGGSCFAQTISYIKENRRLRIYGADITELKHAEEQLKASLKEVNDLKAALDEHAIVAITGPQGKITYVNDKFCSISKYSRSELLGQDHRIINSGYHPKEFIRDLWNTIMDGKVWHGEIKNKAKDGSFYWVDTTIVPFLNEAGKPRQYIAIRTDITARKCAQEAQERLAALVNSSDDAIIGETLDGIITDWNPGAESLLGYTAAELIGKPIAIAFPPERIKEEEEVLVRIARGESVKHYETVRVRKDGRRLDVSVTISPILNQAGKIVGASKVARDITERKRAEAEIRRLNAGLEARVAQRTAELEAANRELEAFSYSVSHDLRAPLRAINGFAGIVLEDFGTQLPEEGRNYLQRMRQGGLRMGELIDDLLAFSRLNRQPVTRQRVDTRELVHEVLAELNLGVLDRPIETRVTDVPDCPGDRALLKQVWTNLLSNAVKYTRGRTPAVIEIGCERTNGECAYFVRDNGVGFDMQYAGKLFGVFQRLHRVDEFEGTGVGLAIVQRVVHRHGGRVWASASPGNGATFYFTLNERYDDGI